MFGFRNSRIYLDFAAAAPVSPPARNAFMDTLVAYGNPSSPHAEGRAAKAHVEEARTAIARLTEVKAEGVIFTSGATEANNLALLGAVRARGAAGSHVLYQAGQHASVIGAIEMLRAEGAVVEVLDMARIEEQLRPETTLVTMDAVNSETGEIFDTLSVRRALDKVRSKARLHVDGAQAPYARSLTLASLGADLLTLDAQKVGGVRGIGALLARHTSDIAPLMRGGPQERGLRPGTQSPALAAAFAAALAGVDAEREAFTARATASRAHLLSRIAAIEKLEVNEGKRQTPYILNLSLIGCDTDYLVSLLDTAGFAVSTKSACESDSETGSRAVLALTGDAERARATLRISWGPTSTTTDLDRFADALIRAVRFLRENAI